MMRVAAAILSALLVSVATPGLSNAEKRKPPADGAAAAAVCKVDADCVLVPDGCCDCSAGGKLRAIPSAKKSADERDRKKRCADTVCPAVMSSDPSCGGTATCKEGRCAIAPPAR